MKMPMCCGRRRDNESYLQLLRCTTIPIAYWTLDEATGTRYNKIVGSPDLVELNPTGSSAGVRGNAAMFDRDSPTGPTGLYCSSFLPDNFTISFWMTAGSGTSWIITESPPTTSHYGFGLWGTSSVLGMDSYPPTGGGVSASCLVAGWNHIVITQAGGGLRKLYVGGRLILTLDEPYTGFDLQTFNVGFRGNYPIKQLTGLMDELVIWDEVIYG